MLKMSGAVACDTISILCEAVEDALEALFVVASIACTKSSKPGGRWK